MINKNRKITLRNKINNLHVSVLFDLAKTKNIDLRAKRYSIEEMLDLLFPNTDKTHLYKYELALKHWLSYKPQIDYLNIYEKPIKGYISDIENLHILITLIKACADNLHEIKHIDMHCLHRNIIRHRQLSKLIDKNKLEKTMKEIEEIQKIETQIPLEKIEPAPLWEKGKKNMSINSLFETGRPDADETPKGNFSLTADDRFLLSLHRSCIYKVIDKSNWYKSKTCFIQVERFGTKALDIIRCLQPEKLSITKDCYQKKLDEIEMCIEKIHDLYHKGLYKGRLDTPNSKWWVSIIDDLNLDNNQ